LVTNRGRAIKGVSNYMQLAVKQQFVDKKEFTPDNIYSSDESDGDQPPIEPPQRN
jgi:hypothetical protein